MNRISDILLPSAKPAECQQILNALFLSWPGAPEDEMSPALLGHLVRCPVCLRKWVALEAAADLAALPAEFCCDEPAYGRDVTEHFETPLPPADPVE